MGLSAEAYARQLKQLLPRGLLWRLDPGSWLSKLLLAISDELARIDGRAEVLVNEWDPRTAVETLPEWERIFGLPSTGTTAQRQAAIAGAAAARGGQSRQYFIGLLAQMGYVATLAETAAHTFSVLIWRPYPSWWGGAVPADGSADQKAVAAAIAKWKPAHTRCASIAVVDGPIWGANMTWGSFTWGGGTTTAWTPPSN
jgi:hypothetical protein